MADYEKDYSGLGFAGGLLKGAAEAWQGSQDRKMKQMELDAHLKAQQDASARQALMDKMTLKEKGYEQGADGSIQEAPQGAREMNQRREGAFKDYAAHNRIPDFDDQGHVSGSHYDPEFLNLKKKERAAAKPTAGETTVDKTFGKDYADYFAGGGKASVDKNLEMFESAIEDLKGGKAKTGGFSAKYLPGGDSDKGTELINPAVAIVRDKIRGAIQGSLKQVLGAQFTEKEGQAIFNRSFNPRLSNEENIERASRELLALRQMAESKDRAAKYYEARGTLAGYKASVEPGGGLVKPGMVSAAKPSLMGRVLPQAQADAPVPVQQHPQDAEAVAWAQANPRDPRAAAILKANGAK